MVDDGDQPNRISTARKALFTRLALAIHGGHPDTMRGTVGQSRGIIAMNYCAHVHSNALK